MTARNLQKVKPATAVAKPAISRGNALNKKAALHKAGRAAVDPIVTNVSRLFSMDGLILGGKIGHIARNCPMNDGGYAGGYQQGYSDSGKTCYACGGFGISNLTIMVN